MPQQSVETTPKSANFSIAFQQMCNFVAISDTFSSSDTCEKLVQQCFIISSETKFRDPEGFRDHILNSYGIEISDTQVKDALDKLQNEKKMTFSGGVYELSLDAHAEIEGQLKNANDLELRVKQEWFAEITSSTDLNLDIAWSTLRSFLTDVFRRHGVHTVSLLDNSISNSIQDEQSLSTLLDQTISINSSGDCTDSYREAITSFLGQFKPSRDRVSYITQLADAAYNYFSLSVPPEVADSLRQRLEPLTLLLDTNFLFGLLDLNASSNLVADNLISAINDSKLPFKLRYHQETNGELRDTVEYQATKLKQQMWPRNLSEAAASSGQFVGVELRYHQKNAAFGVDVQSFLEPYEHPDILLKAKKVDIYRTESKEDELTKLIEYEYQAFLAEINKDKSSEIIEHDSIVLATAHRLRSEAKSSLAAGALLVTFDYTLYRFDQRLSRDKEWLPCTVLPESFLQILRPYLVAKHDYDEAFARAFAFPEFRTMSGKSSEAASKLLSIMAGYQNFPEETAARILSNRPLLEGVNGNISDEEIKAQLKDAIGQDHALLAEENVRLRQEREELERQKYEKENVIGEKNEELLRKKEYEEELQGKLVEVEKERDEESKNSQSRLREYHSLQQTHRALSLELEERREKKYEISSNLQTIPAKKQKITVAWAAIVSAIIFALIFPVWPSIPSDIKTTLQNALNFVGLGSLTLIGVIYFITKFIVDERFKPEISSLTQNEERYSDKVSDIKKKLEKLDEEIDGSLT